MSIDGTFYMKRTIVPPTSFNDLAWRTATIDERVSLRNENIRQNSAFVSDRIAAWLSRASDGEEALFFERLAADGLDHKSAESIVDDGGLANDTPVPYWLDDITWIMEALHRRSSPARNSDLLDPQDRLPFEDLFVSLVFEASSRANLHNNSLLETQAMVCIQRLLLRRLSISAARPLFECFTLFNTFGPMINPDEQPQSAENCFNTARYDAFVKNLQEGGFLAVLEQRPILTRILVTITKLWIDSVGEVISRLRDDMLRINSKFNAGRNVGKVVRIDGGLSDPHNGGRTVLKLQFSNGLEIGYKPKSLAVDIAFKNLVGWLSRSGAPPSCGVSEVLDRGEYGWTEWINPRPCAAISEVKSFFQRAGATLCLFNVLGGVDFHAENIIALGNIPYPVDLETLFHPHPPWIATCFAQNTATERAAVRLKRSVLASYYLPTWTLRPDDILVKAGGLNPHLIASDRYAGFLEINTDGMKYATKQQAGKRSENLPSFNGVYFTGIEYGAAVASGFTEMYRFLSARRIELCSDKGPLSEFKGIPVRAVLRPTALYSLLVEQSLRPHVLSNGFTWTLHFEHLVRSSRLLFCSCPVNWDLLRSERQALAKLDIPYFSTKTDCRDLHLPDGNLIKDFFSCTSIEQQRSHIMELSESHMLQQIEYIHWACGTKCHYTPQNSNDRLPKVSRNNTGAISREDAIQLCHRLATCLINQAVWHENGAAWIGGVPLADAGHAAELEVVGHGLYSGGAGIALFFSALYDATRESKYKRLALSAFTSLHQELAKSELFFHSIGIGGGLGVGSIIYGLVRSALLLDERSLIDDAAILAKQITDERIAQDCRYDVMAGAAGAVLGLLTLYAELPNQLTLDRAIACGHHLAANQIVASEGGAWSTLGGRCLTGMSHGASGIAMALSRLHQCSGIERFLSSSQRAMQFERSVFSTEQKNWPDLRPRSDKLVGYLCQWCHGATGIGLARLDCISHFNDDDILGEIEAALSTTRLSKLSMTDDLCCGNFGRVEFLIASSLRLSRPDLLNAAHTLTSAILRRASNRGDFYWRSGSMAQNPGFHSGIAGIGYELLRITAPSTLSSVLLWH